MKAHTMRRLRQIHHYIGVFFAPMILLFSLSGALQTFRIPDRPGAAGWIVWMAAIHKDQAPPHARRARPEGAQPGGPAMDTDSHDDHDHDGDHDHNLAPGTPDKPSPFPLKVFVGLLSIGLALSTLLGVAIALNNRGTRRMSIGALVAGTVLPLLLLLV